MIRHSLPIRAFYVLHARLDSLEASTKLEDRSQRGMPIKKWKAKPDSRVELNQIKEVSNLLSICEKNYWVESRCDDPITTLAG